MPANRFMAYGFAAGVDARDRRLELSEGMGDIAVWLLTLTRKYRIPVSPFEIAETMDAWAAGYENGPVGDTSIGWLGQYDSHRPLGYGFYLVRTPLTYGRTRAAVATVEGPGENWDFEWALDAQAFIDEWPDGPTGWLRHWLPGRGYQRNGPSSEYVDQQGRTQT